jgi:rubrerythrin
MDKLSLDYFLRFSFNNSIDKEEHLLNKYDEYYNLIKDEKLKEIIKEFMKTSNEHVKLLKDKRLVMNFEK